MAAERAKAGGARGTQAEMAQALGTAILDGTHAVGTTLPNEADLMLRFGVSRTVVREVIKTLAAKGLVASKTKVGTRVLDDSHWNMFDADLLGWRVALGLDAAFLKHLFEIRLAVEPAAARLAAARHDAGDLRRMRALVERMLDSDHDPVSFAAVDVDFHLAVTEASRNPFMRSIGAVIQAALMHSFTLVSPVGEEARRSTSEAHGRIVEAIAAGDAESAAAAMVAVIGNGMRRRCDACKAADARASA